MRYLRGLILLMLVTGCATQDCASDLSRPLSECLTTIRPAAPSEWVKIQCDWGHEVIIRAGSIKGNECDCVGGRCGR